MNLNMWVIQIAPENSIKKANVKFDLKPKARKNQYQILELAAGDFKFENPNETYFGDRKLLTETEKKDQTSEKFGYNGELIVQIHEIKVLDIRDDNGDSEMKKDDILKHLHLIFQINLKQGIYLNN